MSIYSSWNNSVWFSNDLPIGHALEVIKVSLHHWSKAQQNIFLYLWCLRQYEFMNKKQVELST